MPSGARNDFSNRAGCRCGAIFRRKMVLQRGKLLLARHGFPDFVIVRRRHCPRWQSGRGGVGHAALRGHGRRGASVAHPAIVPQNTARRPARNQPLNVKTSKFILRPASMIGAQTHDPTRRRQQLRQCRLFFACHCRTLHPSVWAQQLGDSKVSDRRMLALPCAKIPGSVFRE